MEVVNMLNALYRSIQCIIKIYDNVMQYCVQDNSLLIRQNYFIYWTNFNSFHTLALYLFAYKILLDNYVMISIISACCHRYSVFDTSIDRYKVYKVETIGDAYMVASGLPTVYERHAQEMSLLALELLDSVKHHVIEHLPQQKLQLRIGCLLYTSPSPRDRTRSRMPSSA